MSQIESKINFPKLDLPPFDPSKYRTWSHMAKIFFIQHELFNIVSGKETNPAGIDVDPKSISGVVRISAETDEVLDGPPSLDSPEPHRKIWDWNVHHGFAYSFLMRSIQANSAAYSKVVDCKTAGQVWEHLEHEYGQSSSVVLELWEAKLAKLMKRQDTSMQAHIDEFSLLIEQLNYHLPPDEKWSDAKINRKFFSTLSYDEWGTYQDGLGDAIAMMKPSDLYARIKARDEAKKEQAKKELALKELTLMTNDDSSKTENSKEANFTKKSKNTGYGEYGGHGGHNGN